MVHGDSERSDIAAAMSRTFAESRTKIDTPSPDAVDARRQSLSRADCTSEYRSGEMWAIGCESSSYLGESPDGRLVRSKIGRPSFSTSAALGVAEKVAGFFGNRSLPGGRMHAWGFWWVGKAVAPTVAAHGSHGETMYL